MTSSEQAWYQQGEWPLIGAILVLLLTNGVALWRIYLQVQAGVAAQLLLKRLDYITRQLSKFYDPLFSLILENHRIFQSAGPPSFPEDHIPRDAASEVWHRILESVILPNNQKIQEIIRERLHLRRSEDTSDDYMKLLTHVAMYRVFTDEPTELYKNFQFPKGVLRNIELHREALIEEREEIRRKEARS